MFFGTCVNKGFRNHALNKAFGNTENKKLIEREEIRSGN